MIECTPWFTEAPVRPGWYESRPRAQAYFNGASWSASCDEDACADERAAAAATPMLPEYVRALRWRGLTRRSHDWFVNEMARVPPRERPAAATEH